MRFLSKKGEISTGFIVELSLGLVALLIFVLLVLQIQSFATVDFFSQTSCWASNTVKCAGGPISGIMPNLCAFETLEEPLDEEGLALVMRDTWWMYKEGTCDFGAAADDVYPVYAFEPKEDLSIATFLSNIISTSRTRPVDDIEKSDYNYFEANTEGQTLCFDMESDGIEELTLEKDETYFIMYYDDQELIGQSYGDRILISTDPSFDKGWAENMITAGAVGAVVAAGAITLAIVTGGTSIAIYAGSVGAFMETLGPASVLYVTTISSKTALIAASSAAAAGTGAGGFYVSSELESDGGCLAYGPTTI